jgi:hypothetical protein
MQTKQTLHQCKHASCDGRALSCPALITHIRELLQGVWGAVARSVVDGAQLQGGFVEAAGYLVGLACDDVESGPVAGYAGVLM